VTLAFVDSSAWIAVSVARDRNYAAATRYLRARRVDRLVTSNAVVAEAATWLIYRGMRSAALALRSRIAAAEQVRMLAVEWVTHDIHERAWEIIDRYADQRFSFADCTSFAICENLRVDHVFGFDTDFVIAGFRLEPGS
jgi:predicted nucleic acid-binding protein